MLGEGKDEKKLPVAVWGELVSDCYFATDNEEFAVFKTYAVTKKEPHFYFVF
jgi:hypothetical protein